jgi:hypothetical protein
MRAKGISGGMNASVLIVDLLISHTPEKEEPALRRTSPNR